LNGLLINVRDLGLELIAVNGDSKILQCSSDSKASTLRHSEQPAPSLSKGPRRVEESLSFGYAQDRLLRSARNDECLKDAGDFPIVLGSMGVERGRVTRLCDKAIKDE